MTTAPDLVAQILRLHTVEKWRVGTIARQLRVHRDVVRRVIAVDSAPVAFLPSPSPLRSSRIDPYRAFMLDTLTKFPTLTSARLLSMLGERGYVGSASHLRHLVARMRPRPAAEAYLRLRTLPGEQAQVDWGHFGHLQIGRARRPLMAFVMVLSYSRRIFLRFFLDAHGATFMRGHAEAFAAFGGCARVVLYDNLKSAVLERRGDAIRFNPVLLEFAAHYRYEPRPVAVARGNEKGRVERAIRYVRDNFFAARAYTDLDDLNAQARAWCDGPASDRRWPQDPTQSVRQAFHAEQANLMALPERAYALDERVAVTVGKTLYARFDLNDYSVPHTHVRRTLSVLADEQRVRILDGSQTLASHARSWDRGQQIEQSVHIEALVDHKRAARAHRACDRLAQAAPASAELLQRAGEAGHSLSAVASELLRLLERYGARALQAALCEALLRRDVAHPNAVRLALERAREAAGQPPPVALVLPEHVARRDAPVRAHDLASYDRTENDDDAA